MVICPNCHKENQDGVAYCTACNTKFAQEPHPQSDKVEPGQKQRSLWLVILLSLLVFTAIFFILEQFPEFRGKSSFGIATSFASLLVGILTGKPGRGIWVSLLVAAIGYFSLYGFGYRVFQEPTEKELRELPFWDGIQEVGFIGLISALCFGGVTGYVIQQFRKEKQSGNSSPVAK